MVADMQHRREQRLHDLLQIKPDQEAAFHTFIAAEEQGRPQRGPGPGGKGPGAERKPLTTPERLDREAKHIAQLQQHLAAVKAFYAVLTPDQRKAFDQMPMMMMMGPMGPMMPMRQMKVMVNMQGLPHMQDMPPATPPAPAAPARAPLPPHS
jgi:hypothetical protein